MFNILLQKLKIKFEIFKFILGILNHIIGQNIDPIIIITNVTNNSSDNCWKLE